MSVFSHVFMCTMYMPDPQRPKEGFGSLGSRVTDSCEPSPGCWKPNLDPLQKPQELLTAEPSLWHLGGLFT